MTNERNNPCYSRKIRNKWYFLVDHAGKTISEVCSLYFISKKTYYKWRKKDLKEDRKYIPRKTHPNLKLTHNIKIIIEETKLKTNYGPEKMRLYLLRRHQIDISTTIIYRYYKRKMLIRKPQKKLSWYTPMKEKLTIKNKGEGVQMDVKYVYELGKRKFKFSVFDPYTKKYHFTIFDTKHSKNCIVAMLNAEKYFGFKFISIQTDNGSEARGEFHDYLTKNNITHYFIPKKSPWWNANVERVHRTIDEEYYFNPLRIWKSPYEWLDYYNNERIHLSLGGLTPQEKCELSTVTT
jgi:putative transposase